MLGAGPDAKGFESLDPMGQYEVAMQNGKQMPSLRIDGPYGAPAEDVRISHMCCISFSF